MEMSRRAPEDGMPFGNTGREGGQFGEDSRQVTDQEQVTPQRYKFTTDELRVLKECNKESFYYRCLPLGTAMGVGAFYAVRSGYLAPSAKWGAGPKMLIGSVLGYFIGKMSYQSKCAEKIMNLPNSPLADVLRKQKGRIGFQESLSLEPGFATAAPIAAPAFPRSEFGPSEPGSFTDVGDTRPMTSFDNESSNITGGDYDTKSSSSFDTTQQMLNDENLPVKNSPFSTSYEELRKRNRDDYDTRGSSLSSNPTLSAGSYPPNDSSQSTRRPSPPPPPVAKAKNIYGDVWDEKPQ